MATAFTLFVTLVFLPVTTCQELAPDSALTQIDAELDLDARDQDAQKHLDAVKDAFADLLATIGSRKWAETTDAEQSTVNATLDNVRNVLESWVKQDFETSQKAIENQVQELVAKTTVTVEMKKKADDIDVALMWCRERERDLLGDRQEKMAKVEQVRNDKEDVCRRMREVANYSWELAAPTSGLCDFSDVTTDGVCVHFAALQKEAEENNAAVEKNQTLYQELFRRCNELMDELDAVVRDTTLNNVPGNTQYTKKKMECDKYARQGNVAMCTFGDRLQEKCQSKADADSLVVKVYHQQEDRVAQWTQSQQIKCKLLRFQNGEQLSQLNVSLIPEPLANCTDDVYVNMYGNLKRGCVHDQMPVADLPCELAIDFVRDVGAMDYMLHGIDSQMTEDKFSCAEGSFTFSGFQWTTGAAASDYVKSDYAATAKLAPLGSHPFTFCATSGSSDDPLTEAS